VNGFESEVFLEELSGDGKFEHDVARRVVLLALELDLSHVQCLVFPVFLGNALCLHHLYRVFVNELFISEHLAHGLMVDLGLIDAESYRQLLLQSLSEHREFFGRHPRELGLVIAVKFLRAHLKYQLLIILVIIFLLFLLEGNVD